MFIWKFNSSVLCNCVKLVRIGNIGLIIVSVCFFLFFNHKVIVYLSPTYVGPIL